MLRSFLIIIFFTFSFSQICFSAGTGDSGSGSKADYYKKGADLIKAAKKLDEKGKTKKALKRYERAKKYLLRANKKNPNKPDTLNYLGYATRKLGDFENAEKYYLQGLQIDPKHTGINEYLGELYVKTNRINLAKERLEVLNGCKCEEYDELKELIEKN